MPLPSFLIIGAAKAGTTSLYHYLRQHPQIYMSPVKETNFMALEGADLDFRGPGDDRHICRFSVTDFNTYTALFDGMSGEAAVGEASPYYLYSEKAPLRIRHYLPNVRLIAILRDPVARAFSHFLMFRRDGREPCSDFIEAIRRGPDRKTENWEWAWQYLEVGFYGTQFERYYRAFDRARVRVFLYEDLIRSPGTVVQEIFKFVGVDPDVTPDLTRRHNVSRSIPRNQALDRFLAPHRRHPLKSVFRMTSTPALRMWLRRQIRRLNTRSSELPPAVRRELIDYYRDDIARLQDLIGQDLRHWLT